MKVTKTIPVPATTRDVLDFMKCELCERTSHNEQWSPGSYEVTEPDVSLRIGTNYPEGGSTETTILDICPTCFEEKLVPWFESQGGTPRKEESDW